MAEGIAFIGFEDYRLTGIRVTNHELGHGSYATVIELEYMGLKCAGKKIHEVLMKQEDTSYTVRRFEEECRLLSQVRHPNIVQFLGVYFQQRVRVPILVMEFLPTNLTSCIENYGVLSKEYSYSILHDVALGLCYLHSQSPAIIHRDLSSNNVLLTPNLTAKISDLGVARMLNLIPLRISHMTQTPGTPAYMPPEVMIADPKYDTSVDEFSYGIMMIHIFSGRWPEPQVGQIRTEPDGRMIPVSEAERREVFLRAIGNDHPLMDLILKCINNHIQARAHASEIVERLAEVVLQFPTSYANRLDDALRQLETVTKENGDMRGENRDLRERERVLKGENQDLREQERILKGENRDLTERERVLRVEIEKKSREIRELRTELELSKIENHTTAELHLQDFRPSQAVRATITWKQRSNLPLKSSEGRTVIINGKVYYGGGTTDSDNEINKYIVCCYDPSQDKWTTLPPLPIRWFSLGQLSGKLVTVGGRKKLDNRATNEVNSYNERAQKWKQTVPPMPTARWSAGVLSLQSATLIVAGGRCTQSSYTDVLEVFSTDRSQWYRTDPLPIPCSSVSLIDIGSTCYALGGYKYLSRLNQALHVSIGDLFRNAVLANKTTHSGSSDTRSAWKTLSKTPSNQPAAAALAGSLLALGGKGMASGGNKKEVHMYLPSNNSWVYFSDLPAPLFGIAVAIMSSTEILVIGGEGNEERMNTVYTGTLDFKL